MGRGHFLLAAGGVSLYVGVCCERNLGSLFVTFLPLSIWDTTVHFPAQIWQLLSVIHYPKSNLINQRTALNVVFIYAISGKHRNMCYSWKQCIDLILTKGEKGIHLKQRHWNWSLREPGYVCRCSVVTAHTASVFWWMGAIYKVPTDKTSSKDTLNTSPSFSISAFYVPTK